MGSLANDDHEVEVEIVVSTGILYSDWSHQDSTFYTGSLYLYNSPGPKRNRP